MLVKLDVVPDRNAAELLRDHYLLIPERRRCRWASTRTTSMT